MAILWMEDFDHYGGSASRFLEGAWAAIDDALLSAPSAGARTGDKCLVLSGTSNTMFARRVLGKEISEVFVSLGLYVEQLPSGSAGFVPIQLRTSSNSIICSLTIRSDGALQFRSGSRSGTVLGTSPTPVIKAATWQHIECRIVRHATAGVFEVRVDEVVAMSLTGLSLGSTDFGNFQVEDYQLSSGIGNKIYIDDLIIKDTSGSFNNGFQGDLRVANLQILANGATQGWTTRSVEKLGLGVFECQDSTNYDDAIVYADNAAFELGAGDFCLETFVRFDDVPSLTQHATFLSKYLASGDQRSYRFFLNGPSVNGNLTFSNSTDGTLANEQEIHSFPWAPLPDRWYHIAVSRQGTTSRMFIDGIQVGLDQTDNRTYYDGTAPFLVNCEASSTTNSLDDTGLDGWMDGVRVTKGAARYTANFTPPTSALPSDLAGDSLYNSVELLLNFDDTSNTDQSANAFVGTMPSGGSIFIPSDGEAFETIRGAGPNDNNSIEAALVPAEGTFTLTANPLDTETVTLGATTYTFQTVLVDAANNVLIGATASDSLDNLRKAVNLESGVGTLYGTGTLINPAASLSDLPGDQILATATTAGTVGNTEPTTTTVTGASWSAATLLGGQDIPGNSQFTISALPPGTTSVVGVSLVGRAFKLDAGSSKMQMSLVTAGGGVSAGADNSMGLSPTYYEDVIETDPNTAGALTPTTVTGSEIRFNRTV